LDISIGNRNEYSKRFNFVRGADGDVAFDDTEAHAVITTYWFDPNHGSKLARLRSLTSRTPSQAEAEALDALLPLQADNSITAVAAVAAADRSNGRLSLDVSWTTPSGTPGGPLAVEV
jgi:phage gp46-like protein